MWTFIKRMTRLSAVAGAVASYIPGVLNFFGANAVLLGSTISSNSFLSAALIKGGMGILTSAAAPLAYFGLKNALIGAGIGAGIGAVGATGIAIAGITAAAALGSVYGIGKWFWNEIRGVRPTPTTGREPAAGGNQPDPRLALAEQYEAAATNFRQNVDFATRVLNNAATLGVDPERVRQDLLNSGVPQPAINQAVDTHLAATARTIPAPPAAPAAQTPPAQTQPAQAQ